MNEYEVSIDSEGIIIKGEFVLGSIPVNIPGNNAKKRSFISLFLNKRDIEHAIDYLRCISLDKYITVNEGLFVSALAMFSKCFVSSKNRIGLDKDGFKKHSPRYAALFDKYDSWRNKHFLHDENRMIEPVAFLLVSPEGSEKAYGGPPSVVWNNIVIDYVTEGEQLEELLEEVWRYCAYRIDKVGDSIAKEYNSLSRDELLKFGKPNIKQATLEKPEKERSMEIG